MRISLLLRVIGTCSVDRTGVSVLFWGMFNEELEHYPAQQSVTRSHLLDSTALLCLIDPWG